MCEVTLGILVYVGWAGAAFEGRGLFDGKGFRCDELGRGEGVFC